MFTLAPKPFAESVLTGFESPAAPLIILFQALMQTQVRYRVDRRGKCFKLERLPNWDASTSGYCRRSWDGRAPCDKHGA